MRLLILGAGATGGYFGGRLAKAGADVTFLVRSSRAEALARDGLRIESPKGDITTPVKTVTQAHIDGPYDAIVLSCKAYDLDAAIAAIRQAAGDQTLILPLLNGMRHIDTLDAAFGAESVLGGTCHISVTLTPEGIVRHFSTFDALTLGPRSPAQAERCDALYAILARGGFETRLSTNVIGAMWEKWVLLATLAGMTCLMRGNIGEIVATKSGAQQINQFLDECCAVAEASGTPPRAEAVAMTRTVLTDPKSAMAASMLRDLQRGARIEADHIIGDLLARGAAGGVPTPLLATAHNHVQVYQNRQNAAAPQS